MNQVRGVHFVWLSAALLASMALSLTLGVVPMSLAQFQTALFEDREKRQILGMILWEIRLPRILLGALAGACLATTGAAIQGLFRNPLADPALIGVSSGAALVAACSMVFGSLVIGPGSQQWLIPVGAFIGGLVSTRLVVWLGTGSGSTSVSLMLLAGIAVNAIAIAGVGIVSYLSDLSELRGVTFWSLGSFASSDWSSVGIAMLLPVVIGLLFLQSRGLDAIILGESEARHLGIPVQRLKRRIIVLTALGIGVTVALSGIVAFVGLVVPHLVRILVGSGHKVVLPASALLGALLVVLADLLARVLVAPAELPVGIVTSLLGGPFFIFLIHRQRRHLGLR